MNVVKRIKHAGEDRYQFQIMHVWGEKGEMGMKSGSSSWEASTVSTMFYFFPKYQNQIWKKTEICICLKTFPSIQNILFNVYSFFERQRQSTSGGGAERGRRRI